MVNYIQNPRDTPQFDSCLPLFTHAKDGLVASSTSVRSSNSTITDFKNAEFLHNTSSGKKDSSQRSKRLSKILQRDNT